jgi:hypothetical protein
MRQLAIGYVDVVDAVNYRIGQIMMYFIHVVIGSLPWSSSKQNASTGLDRNKSGGVSCMPPLQTGTRIRLCQAI